MQIRLTARSYLLELLPTRLRGLYRAAVRANHEPLMMNEMVVRNMQSSTKIVEEIHKESASCWIFYIININRFSLTALFEKF
jgi:hypothetical protein